MSGMEIERSEKERYSDWLAEWGVGVSGREEEREVLVEGWEVSETVGWERERRLGFCVVAIDWIRVVECFVVLIDGLEGLEP